MSRNEATELSGTISPLALRVFRLTDGVQVLAEIAVGLRRDAVGAAEKIEIIDILRAEIDLQRLEHVVGVDAQHLGADAVDIGIDLRRLVLKVVNTLGSPGVWLAAPMIGCGHAFELRQVAAMGVLHLHLEAARRADAAHRRRRHADDEALPGSQANCWFSVPISACALCPFSARCLNASSGVNTTAAFGAVVKVAPSSPTIGTAWAMPGVSSTILVTLRAISSVRASEAPGGSWMMLIR